MGKRIIFHVDVNNAFLSWSALLLLKNGYRTDIRKIPAVIGGDESKRHGIVLAKSSIAKKYGIKTADTLYLARKKCKNVQVFPPNYEWYYEQSKKFHSYLRQFSPQVEKYSIDEAYIDLTGTKYIYNDYIKLAYFIKDDIKKKFGFTVNIGVANNMLCAKMASDFEKPDKVHTLFEEEVKEKMWPLAIEKLFMVGKSTALMLRKLDINTIGDLANVDMVKLRKYFKNQAQFLKDSASGIDYNKVERTESKNPSISVSETLSRDIDNLEELKPILFRQTAEVARQLRSKDKYCRVVAIIYKNCNFESYSKQVKLDNATNDTNTIYKTVLHLLDISFKGEPIRLIGIRLADLSNVAVEQISLFSQEVKKSNTSSDFQKIVDSLNNKFGNNTIIPASMKKTNHD